MNLCVHILFTFPSVYGSSNKSGFPQIIGAIDGCHVAINRPKEDGNSYFNRKKFYSVVLQAVCKADRSFIDIDCR
jgi:hypothetical protein